MARGVQISSAKFRGARQRLFLTQSEMARKLEITLGGVQRTEGHACPVISYSTLRKLSEVMGVEPSQVVEEMKAD